MLTSGNLMDFLSQYFRKLFTRLNLYILKEKLRKNRVFQKKLKFVLFVQEGGAGLLISNIIRKKLIYKLSREK